MLATGAVFRRVEVLTLLLAVAGACGGSDATGPADVASIVIGGVPAGPLLVGNTVQLIATPVNSSGAVVSNQTVSWRTSNASLATVNGSGTVLAVGAGPVTVTATAAGHDASVSLDLRAGGPVTTVGGTLNMLNGAVTLTVPANALSQTVTILLAPTINPAASPKLVPGAAYDLGPDGLLFARGSSLAIRYDPSKLPAGVTEASLQLYVVNAGAWALVAGSSVNTQAKTVTGTISRFGTYAVVGTGVDHLTIGGAAGSALYVGQNVQLTAAMFDALNNSLAGRVVTWTSSDPTRASIDTAGRVTGVGPGSVTITATSETKIATTTITVLPRVAADWSQATDWTTFQGNATHTGFVPVSADPVMFQERWVSTVGSGTPLSQVATGNGSVFVSTGSYFGAGAIAALNAVTGVSQWSVAVGSNNSTMAPAYDAGSVYMQTNDLTSYLWGFDATTGTTRFRVVYSSQWSTYFAPVIVGQTIYMGCGTYDGLCAQSVVDGKQIWFAATNQYDGWTPTVTNGVVYTYTGDYSPNVTATDATTGKTLFQIPDPDFSWNGWTMGVAPVYGSASDLIATQGNRLVAFDLTGRKVAWQQTGTFNGQPAVAAGVIYVFNNNQIEARNEADGSLLWLWIPPEGKPAGNMLLTRNLLFASTAANTYAIDLGTHRTVWSYPAGGQLSLSAQGMLFIARSNGKLSGITLK